MMDYTEFRKRLYASPDDPGREVLDAAAANPEWQALVDRSREFERDVRDALTGVAVPAGLAERLLAIPEQPAAGVGNPVATGRSTHLLQYYAMAACLVLAIGVLFGLKRNPAPAATELVMGQDIIRHLYHEETEIDAIAAGSLNASYTMPDVNRVMAHAGTTLGTGAFLENMPVRYANPCRVLPGYQSSHLILQTADGPLNVIVINNSPVAREFTIRDERFHGRVIPMDRGNLVLIGETDGSVDDYRDLLTAGVEWVI
ncbi:MAG: DUF3379 family protein [Pseudohongiellaceae bacterium]